MRKLIFSLLAWSAWAQSPLYSPLKQIDRSNVARLAKAWQFDSGDEFKGSEMQCRPLVIDGMVYATTPKLRVIALDG
ncbi:MAG: hypothetical protein MUC42_07230, partial [Bryobacter sp.]|nr:hypothetical protein [Bryobacter sp.]